MAEKLLSQVLEAEHHRIDDYLDTFAASVADGTADSAMLHEAFTLLRRHIYVEEEFLYPPLREGGMTMPIFVMEREHGEIWQLMDTLDEHRRGGGDPHHVISLCQELLELLDKHNAKEEPIVYPQADLTLSATATRELHAFLATGTMPEGWACRMA